MFKKIAVCLLASFSLLACSSEENTQYPAPPFEAGNNSLLPSQLMGNWNVTDVNITLDCQIKGLKELVQTDKCQMNYYSSIQFFEDGNYTQLKNKSEANPSQQKDAFALQEFSGKYNINGNVITLYANTESSAEIALPAKTTLLTAFIKDNKLELTSDETDFMHKVGLAYYANKYKELDELNAQLAKHWSDPSYLTSTTCITMLQK